MQLHALDWIIVALSLLICFVPELFVGRRAGFPEWEQRTLPNPPHEGEGTC